MTQTAIENTITKTFRIPEQNIEYLQDKIAELNKRAKRLHCSPITLEVLEIERVEHDEEVDLFYHVQISGEAPRIKCWTFVAVIEHLDEGNLVHAVPDMLEDAELINYRSVAPVCEHCKIDRPRNNTYILRSLQNQFKQVGRQCLVDFLGHDDPMSVAHDAQYLAEACELAEECIDDDFMSGGSSSKLDTEYFLRWVHMSMRTTGWCPRSKAGYGVTATVDDALYCMDKYKKYKSGPAPTEQDREVTKKALEWIRESSDWDPMNDFLYGLHIVCKSSIIHVKHTAIAATLFMAYNRAMEKARERQSQMTSEWQGEVGEKKLFTLKCDSVFYQENCYGRRATTTAIYRLSDENGNRFTWFSSNDVLEVGNNYNLKGTIKALDEYKGVKQTVLTRCKVQ